jgi:hypothetical protein
LGRARHIDFRELFEMDVQCNSYNGGLEMDAVSRADEHRPRNAEHIGKDRAWRWKIECQEGEISFWSSGYKQFIRRKPILSSSQSLDLKTRGISFERGRAD